MGALLEYFGSRSVELSLERAVEVFEQLKASLMVGL